MFDVLTSVWSRFEINSEDAAGTTKEAEIDQRQHHSALALGGSLFAANVSNLWLSPQQTSLEGVMEGVDRVDRILKNLQHVTAITKGEYRSLQKNHRTLKDKHDHLTEWSEKETIRKSGMKEFECQFNSNLREPRDTSVQSDVTWLSRIPQMRDNSADQDKPEKVVFPMTAKVDDKMMMSDIRKRGSNLSKQDMKQSSHEPSAKQRHVTVASSVKAINSPVAVATSPKIGGALSPTSPRKLSHWGTARARGAGSRRSMMMKAAASSFGASQRVGDGKQRRTTFM